MGSEVGVGGKAVAVAVGSAVGRRRLQAVIIKTAINKRVKGILFIRSIIP
jgi:hypothetical protein